MVAHAVFSSRTGWTYGFKPRNANSRQALSTQFLTVITFCHLVPLPSPQHCNTVLVTVQCNRHGRPQCLQSFYTLVFSCHPDYATLVTLYTNHSATLQSPTAALWLWACWAVLTCWATVDWSWFRSEIGVPKLSSSHGLEVKLVCPNSHHLMV